MTPRERMLATLGHRRPDRVPIQLGCREEIMERLRRHYGVATHHDVAGVLQADLTRNVSVGHRFEAFERRLAAQPPERVPAGRGTNALWLDDRTFEDRWGVRQRYGSDGKYVQWMGGPLVEADDLDAFGWPAEGDFVAPEGLAEQVAAHKAAGYWVTGSGPVHPFKQAWHMRGFENFLCDYVARPGWVERIYDRFVEYDVRCCRALAAAGVDMIEFWGDVAMQDRMIVPPDAWRRLDKPAWRTIIDRTRQVDPGVRFFFHSDGDITPIIDDLIEVGFDVLNPLQPECVNPAEIKRRWGDRLTLDGGGSVQRTLPRGRLDDVRREVEFLLTCCAYDGGYVFRASNVVPFDCPTENVVAFYELARDFDLSQLAGPPEVIPEPPCRHVL
ncbi:MAG TPA: uroporphyrinogen decarboxylase family protein [Phycisphaerae bacterium]|nr:uroporphyrinogen decarboxylase family protein [Phycisphaerae bacterium]